MFALRCRKAHVHCRAFGLCEQQVPPRLNAGIHEPGHRRDFLIGQPRLIPLGREPGLRGRQRPPGRAHLTCDLQPRFVQAGCYRLHAQIRGAPRRAALARPAEARRNTDFLLAQPLAADFQVAGHDRRARERTARSSALCSGLLAKRLSGSIVGKQQNRAVRGLPQSSRRRCRGGGTVNLRGRGGARQDEQRGSGDRRCGPSSEDHINSPRMTLIRGGAAEPSFLA
jgi:hypothetical protein